MSNWWDGLANERYWLETTDRDDLGVDLNAPQTNESGGEYWGYSLINFVRVGDLVAHYAKSEQAIVAWSRAAGPSVEGDVVWGARGTSARSKSVKPYLRKGWRLSLDGPVPLDEAITLTDLRSFEDDVAASHDGLPLGLGQTAYFPFALSTKRELRPTQAYLTKFPASLVEALRFRMPEAGLFERGPTGQAAPPPGDERPPLDGAGGQSQMRNASLPPWATDELILALDLYYLVPEAQSNKNHAAVLEVSDLLRRLPLHPGAADASAKFRNPEGVYMKLMNFRHDDPDHPGTGLKAGGALDTEVFQRFYRRREELHRLAGLIRSSADPVTAPEGAATPVDDEDDEGHAEGRIVYRVHRSRERSRGVIKKAKARMRERLGRLECEVCGVPEAEYARRYGLADGDLYECHHRVPLADLAAVQITKATDLAVLCPTCHRAIHRRDPLPTVEALAATVAAGPSKRLTDPETVLFNYGNI